MACFLVWLVSISNSWFPIHPLLQMSMCGPRERLHSIVHILHHGSRLITMLVSVHINRSDKAKSFHDKMINFRLTLLSSI